MNPKTPSGNKSTPYLSRASTIRMYFNLDLESAQPATNQQAVSQSLSKDYICVYDALFKEEFDRLMALPSHTDELGIDV